MKRKIPENRAYFEYKNVNPKGNRCDDCVIRTLSEAMNKSWDDVFNDLIEYSKKYKLMSNDTKIYSKYLKDNGWIKTKQLRKWDNKKYTGIELCKELQDGHEFHLDTGHIINYNNTIICHIGHGHITTIKNGKIIDSWDPSYSCVGVMWIKN